MRSLGSLKFWKHLGLIGLALNLSAFTTPQKDELVELQGFLYGRSDAKFRNMDQNKLYVLKPGTRAVIVETKFFEDTKNYGLCLDIKNATDLPANQKCIWVYYDVKNPALRLYSGITDKSVRQQIVEAWAKDPLKVTLKNESSPEKAQAAQTTRTVQGVVEKSSTPTTETKSAVPAAARETAPQKSPGVDSETPVKIGIQSLAQVNKNLDKAMAPSSQPCIECSKPKVVAYESCNSRNDYLENALSAVLNQSAYAAFFQSPQKEIITTSCIQKNMSVFTKSSAYFRSCGPRQSAAGGHIQKACISENYVNVVAKSFNLAAECLGNYISGDEAAKEQSALSIFSLMSLESGMNINAMSGKGPGGPGQMSGGAITAVNGLLKDIRKHLAKSENPQCSQVLGKALATPMSSDRSCDRISIYKDNPLKSVAYAFAYQAALRHQLDRQVFNSGVFSKVISSELPIQERERLIAEVTAWAHNTGPAGMVNPVRAALMFYSRNHKAIRTGTEVTKFLKDLRPFLASHAHSANRARSRITETMNYYGRIQKQMSYISKEPRACLAN